MKKIATLLVFVLSIQVTTPSFAQTSAAAQTKALQECMEDLVNKALAPENLKNVNFGERKFLDKLAATKALFVWSLGDDFEGKSKGGFRWNEIGKGSVSLVASVVGIGFSPRLFLFRNNWKIPKSKLIGETILGLALLSVCAYIFTWSFDKIASGFSRSYTEFVQGILNASSNDEIYRQIANDESKYAYNIRGLALEGCNQIRTQVQYYIDNPDLFIADMNEMKKNYSTPVLRDSDVIDGIKMPSIRFPSNEKGLFVNPTDTIK